MIRLSSGGTLKTRKKSSEIKPAFPDLDAAQEWIEQRIRGTGLRGSTGP
jgi:hypothetical protein